MTTPPMRSEQRGSALVLTIDRPEAKNAINRELAERLRDAITAAAGEEQVRAIVIAATGSDVFVAGGDLKEFQQLDLDAAGAQQILDLGMELGGIEESPVPVIAAVQGDVLGGGCELLVCCDLAIVEEHAHIEFRHVSMGLTPAWGGTTRLMERVGSLRAAELLLTGRRLTATEAASYGVVNQVVPRGKALAAALALVERLARHERASVAAVKRSLTEAKRAARGDALRREHEVFLSAWGSAGHQSAMAAFLKRR